MSIFMDRGFMEADKSIYSMLKELGMTEYESRAYMALLQHGNATAEIITQTTDIPLTRVYETLASLEKLGLLQVLKTRPKRYKISGTKSLSNIIELKKEKFEKDIERQRQIITEFQKIKPASPGDSNSFVQERYDVWMTEGRMGILKNVVENEKKARSSILIFSDDISWFPEFRQVFRKKTKEGVQIKLLCNINDNTISIVNELIGIGLKVKHWEMIGLTGHVIDGNKIQLVSKIPRKKANEERYYGVPGSDDLFSYKCLTTNNPVLINMVTTYFNFFWWKGSSSPCLVSSGGSKK